MRAAKMIGLWIIFSFAGFVIVSVFSIVRSTASFETSHAIALSAIIGGLLEALLNPITLLVIVIAFVAATWVTRKTSKRTST